MEPVETYLTCTRSTGSLRVLDGPDIAVSQLSKSHFQELVDAGEVLDFMVASVHGDVTAKSAQRRNAMS